MPNEEEKPTKSRQELAKEMALKLGFLPAKIATAPIRGLSAGAGYLTGMAQNAGLLPPNLSDIPEELGKELRSVGREFKTAVTGIPPIPEPPPQQPTMAQPVDEQRLREAPIVTGQAQAGKVAAGMPSPGEIAQLYGMSAFPEAEAGFESQMKAIEQANLVSKKGFDSEVDLRKFYQKRINDELMQQRVKANAEKEQSDKLFARMQDISDQMINIGKEDSNWWSDASFPKKLLAGTVLALSAATRNPLGVGIIEDIINREKERQKFQIETLGKVADLSNLAWGRYQQSAQNSRVADDAFMEGSLKMLENGLHTISAGTSSEMAKSKIDAAIGEIQVKRADLRMKMAQSYLDGINSNLTPGISILTPEQIKDPNLIPDEKLRERWVPYGSGLAATPKAAEMVMKDLPDLESAVSDVDKLLRIMNIPLKSLRLDVRSDASATAQGLIGILRIPFTGPGTLNPREIELLQNLARNPTNIFSLDVVNKGYLNSIRDKIERQKTIKLNAAGVKYIPTQKGLESLGEKF